MSDLNIPVDEAERHSPECPDIRSKRDLTTLSEVEEYDTGKVLSAKFTYIDKDDFRLIWSIAEQGFTINDVLPNGLTIQLLPISNLSAGGTSIDVTSDVHPEFAALACNVARSLGLRFAGVDLITNTPISKPPMQGQHWLIEVNSAPGLDHYARMGNEQQLVVEDLYYEVIRSMERPNEY